jgi:hypothetical protein
MARPDPTILAEQHEPRRIVQVIAAPTNYTLTFDGQPVALRFILPSTAAYYKYPRASWTNGGHAYNMADKLNRMFKTKAFGVAALSTNDHLAQQSVASSGCGREPAATPPPGGRPHPRPSSALSALNTAAEKRGG